MAVSAGIAGAVGAVASAGSSIAKGLGGGGAQGQSDASGAEANALAQKASDLWANLKTPTFDTTPLKAQTWQQDYVPETYDPWIGQSYNMTDDQASLDAQNKALSQLQQLAKGGLQPSDMIALNQIERSQANAATSNNAAAADALRNRGVGGAGSEYAARLLGNQSAANNASNLYDQAMKAAMDRQTAAINSSGTLAGNIRSQSNDVSQRMAAMNNAFNTEVQNLRTNAASNAAQVRNAAQLANQTGRQNVANNVTSTANAQTALNNQLYQQNFANQEAQITGQSNALNKQQNLASANQAAFAQQAMGADQSLTSGLNGLAGLAKQFTGNSSSGSASGSSVGDWFNNLTNPPNGGNWTGDGSGVYLPNTTGDQNYLDNGTWDLSS